MMPKNFFKLFVIGLVLVSSVNGVYAMKRTQEDAGCCDDVSKQRVKVEESENGYCCICTEEFEKEKDIEGIDRLIVAALDRNATSELRFINLIRLFSLGRWKIIMFCCGNKDNFICSKCALKIADQLCACPLCKKSPFSGAVEVNGIVFKFRFPIPVKFFAVSNIFEEEMGGAEFLTDTELKEVISELLNKHGMAVRLLGFGMDAKAAFPNIVKRIIAKRQTH
ncbi:MAG: hypothetical protein WCS92_03460 [Candidatus Babeliales bacterium]